MSPEHPLISRQDINGDAGSQADAVVGMPSAGDGRVEIRFDGGGTAQQLSRSSFAGLPASSGTGDRFGSAIAYADLDGNACNDLVLGAQGEGTGPGSIVAAVAGTDGVSTSGAALASGRTVGEHFGTSVAVLDQDVFVGAPDRPVTGLARPGAVDWYHWAGPGRPVFVRSFTQNTAGVPGVAEAGERFGTSLLVFRGRLLVGDANEAVGSQPDAGTVTVPTPTTATLRSVRVLSRLTPNVPGDPERGDRFGYALVDDLPGVSVGTPGAREGRADGAGAVHSFDDLALTYAHVITENSAGIPGTAALSGHFGAAATSSRTCARTYFQGTGGGLGGTARSDDLLGSSLATVAAPYDESTAGEQLRPDQLSIGVPGEGGAKARDAGTVIITRLDQSPSGYHLLASSRTALAGPLPGQRYGQVQGSPPQR